jgi:hypothetical protein
MNSVVTTRLCWNCEGDVEPDSESCPCCGVDLGSESEDRSPEKTFEPTYKTVKSSTSSAVPEPVYRVNSAGAIADSEWSEAINGEKGQEEIKTQVAGVRSWLSPLVMLLSGSVFFLFGLVLFLFSVDGVFTLRWNANFSLLYLLGSVPLLYYGWNALEKIQD